MALDAFAEEWDDKYPQISKSWRTHWENLNTFFGYPVGIEKMEHADPELAAGDESLYYRVR